MTKPSYEEAGKRCNLQTSDDGLRLCRGLHDSADDCEWEYYVSAESLARVRGLLQRGYHLVNVAGSCADEPEEVGDKWMEEVESELKTGAESADIGKLDSADKKVAEFQPCLTCDSPLRCMRSKSCADPI